MCTGVELLLGAAGAAASAFGAAQQQKEVQQNAQRAAKARNDELKRTLTKNDLLAKDSRNAFNERNEAIKKDQIQNDQVEQTQKREDSLVQAVDSAPSPTAEGASLSGSAPTVVKTDLAKRLAGVMGDSKMQAQAQAKLGGYGDSWLEQGFRNVDAGRTIAEKANFAGGNMALLPYQQDIAEMHSQKPISPIGGLLQGLGGAIGSFGGSGGSLTPKKKYTSPFTGPGLY